jgi:hypothetical protein
LWPFIALGYLSEILAAKHARALIFPLGAVAVVAVTTWLEWMQLSIPGRYGDLTTILLAFAGWAIPWLLRPRRQRP